MENVLREIESGIAALLVQPWFSLLARVALTAAFWLSGISKLANFPGAVAEIRGLTSMEPAALVAAIVIAVQIGGSLLVIWGGRWAWFGAGALGVFTLAATLMAHAWWTKTGVERVRDFNTFWEHMGLIGGLMLAAILAAVLANRSVNPGP